MAPCGCKFLVPPPVLTQSRWQIPTSQAGFTETLEGQMLRAKPGLKTLRSQPSNLVDISVPKKIPPPLPKCPNSPQTLSRPLGPSCPGEPPPPGIFNNRSSLLPAPWTPLSPSPRKNKNYLNHCCDLGLWATLPNLTSRQFKFPLCSSVCI